MRIQTVINGRSFASAVLAVLVIAGMTASVVPAQPPEKIRQPSETMIKRITEAMPSKAIVRPAAPRKVLVFWRCEGFFHTSIPVANKAFEIMGKKTGAFDTVVSDDMAMFDPENLNQFDAVLFNNTTQLKFENPTRREALMAFAKGGKGIIGIHAAADNFYNWPEAADMLGGLFDGHPWGAGGTWAVKNDDPDHPLNKAFGGKGFSIRDEIYQMKTPPYSRDSLRVLLTLDMSNERNLKVKGMKREDNDYAVAWIREYGNGRVFYCGLGHNNEIFWNEAILHHYLAGIQYALGDLDADATPSAKLSTQQAVGTGAAVWQELFDGRSLDGWVQRGGDARYRVEDDAIVGSSVKGTPNSFLCTKKTFSDFVLELDFKVDPGLNSGVQVRSDSSEAYKKGRVHGYQVEIDPSNRAWSGGIYDEGRRGWLYDLSVNEPARKAFKQNEWNHFRIEAVGDSIKTWLNDVPAANLVDAMAPKGFIALQVHGTDREEPLEVRWRDIRVQELKEPYTLPSRPDAPPVISLNDLGVWREPTADWQIVSDTFLDPDNEKRLAWKDGTGVAVNGPKGVTRHLFTKMEHADIEAHIEFMVPKGSNSGVYFQGRYEIQVLDSWGVEKPEFSDCGGIYQRWDKGKGYEGRPPRVNASRKPGEWQSFDVTFRAPRFDANGNKTANAMFVKVVHNGIVVHENEEVTGPTRAAAFNDEKPIGPLMFQGDHGPVAYRNIRVRSLNPNLSPAAASARTDNPYETFLAYKYGDSRDALVAIEEDIRAATQARRKEIEATLSAALASPEATYDAKQFACRMLRRIGTAESVPALANLLGDEKLSHMARYALEDIPAPAVDRALRAALRGASGSIKVGIVNSLGERGDTGAVDALGKLLTDEDPAVAVAAAAALGKIGGSDAIGMLAGARSVGNQELRQMMFRSYLQCADRLLAQGQAQTSATMYNAVYASDWPVSIRAAGLRGLAASRGEDAVDLVAGALADGSPGIQAMAVKLARDVPGTPATRQFAALMPSLAAPVKVGLLAALADRGGIAARTAATAAARDQETSVRTAALKALAVLGDSSTIPLLAEAAATSTGEERQAARESLARLRGRDVNAAILTAAHTATPVVRAELIRAWAQRLGTDPIRLMFERPREPGVLASAK
jgi:type 1 glutamine amidotransferase/HEAT repeat protein